MSIDKIGNEGGQKALPTTIACGKRAGLCVIEVCISLFIFITVDRAKVFICPPATSKTLVAMWPASWTMMNRRLNIFEK
jgi:hypothetical protein